jgi:hypothetical protein
VSDLSTIIAAAVLAMPEPMDGEESALLLKAIGHIEAAMRANPDAVVAAMGWEERAPYPNHADPNCTTIVHRFRLGDRVFVARAVEPDGEAAP